MVVRDIDFNYFLDECITKGGAPEDVASKTAAIKFSDKFSKEFNQGPQTWNKAEYKWEDVPELSQVLAPDSGFGRVRFRRKTCAISLLDANDKVLWTNKKK